MPKIYQGDIKSLYISKLEVEKGVFQLRMFESILLKNELFYKDKTGNNISFKYDSSIRNRVQAEDHLLESEDNSVLFVDEEDLEFVKMMDNSQFKQLKKKFKERLKDKDKTR